MKKRTALEDKGQEGANKKKKSTPKVLTIDESESETKPDSSAGLVPPKKNKNMAKKAPKLKQANESVAKAAKPANATKKRTDENDERPLKKKAKTANSKTSAIAKPRTKKSQKAVIDSLSTIGKKIREAAIKAAVDELIRLQEGNEGRLPFGAMEKVLLELKNSGIEQDRHSLNYRKRLVLQKRQGGSSDQPLNESELEDVIEVVESPAPPVKAVKKAGRPKGSSAGSKVYRQKRRVECINDIVACYAAERRKIGGGELRGKPKSFGFLKNLIIRKWQEYDLDKYEDTKEPVPAETIRSRFKRRSLFPDHPGSKPPLDAIEKLIVERAREKSADGQPYNPDEWIELANSLIEADADLKAAVIDWKRKRYPDFPLEDLCKVGKGWWQGFTRRHGHRLNGRVHQTSKEGKSDTNQLTSAEDSVDDYLDPSAVAGVGNMEIDQPMHCFEKELGAEGTASAEGAARAEGGASAEGAASAKGAESAEKFDHSRKEECEHLEAAQHAENVTPSTTDEACRLRNSVEEARGEDLVNPPREELEPPSDVFEEEQAAEKANPSSKEDTGIENLMGSV